MVYAIMAALVVIVVAGVALFVFFLGPKHQTGQLRAEIGDIDWLGHPIPDAYGPSSVGTSFPWVLRDWRSARAIEIALHGNRRAYCGCVWQLDGEVVEHAGALEQTVCGSSQREPVQTIKTPAARGRIFDTQGIVMVDNKRVPPFWPMPM